LTPREPNEHRQHLERRLEQERGEHRTGQRLPHAHRHVRQHVVHGEQEEEHAEERYGDRDDVRDDAVADEAGCVALQHLDAERTDHEAEEERHDRADHHAAGHALPLQEGPVRLAVHDVQGRLERAEERHRRPEEEDAADDPQRRCVVLHPVDEREDALDGAAGECVSELLDEEVRRVGAVGEAEERQREEHEGHEGEQREVGDHRGEMRPAVGEELRREGSLADAHERSLHGGPNPGVG